MKHRVLITTNTYFQLIVAVQLKLTRFSSDEVDVIITDHSAGSEEAAERLRELGLFRGVFFVRDSISPEHGSLQTKCSNYARAWLRPRTILSEMVRLNDDYDTFLFHNASLLTHLIWRVFRLQVTCYRFEEGFSTYTRPFLEKKPLFKVLIKAGFGDLEKHTKGLFLFHPELWRKKTGYPVITIPPMEREDHELQRVFNHTFGYDAQRDGIPEKYIFMEESFRASGVEIDDVELVCEIAEAVGRENLVVKLHPRSTEDPFSACGLKVSRLSQVPWEVVLLNENLSEKTLLTITSGSVLASALYFEQRIRAYLLYRCITKKSPMLNDEYFRYMRDVCAHNESFLIPEDMGELMNHLENLNGDRT